MDVSVYGRYVLHMGFGAVGANDLLVEKIFVMGPEGMDVCRGEMHQYMAGIWCI